MSDPQERPDGRRSWVVAFVGAVAMVFTFGTPLSYGIFHGPFTETFDVSPVAMSTVFSVMLFTFFIGSGLVGVFATRVDARGVMVVCAGATALIAPSLSLVDSLAGLLVVFAILGLALGTAFVLLASIVPRWFEERRGAATGLIFVGNGLGLTVLPPAWQFAIGTIGVERAFLAIMSTTALAFFLAGLVCRRPRWADASTASTADLVGWLGGLVGRRSFQLIFLGMGLAFAWYQLLAAFAVDLFASRGLSEVAASTAFGLIGGVSIISRIGGGYVADVVGARRSFLASLLCASAGLGLLFFSSLPIVAVGIFLVGIGLGACATLYIPLLMQLYDPSRDTAIIGIFNVAGGIGALAMPPLGAASVAYTGSYAVALALTIAVVLTAFWLVVVGTRIS